MHQCKGRVIDQHDHHLLKIETDDDTVVVGTGIVVVGACVVVVGACVVVVGAIVVVGACVVVVGLTHLPF
jgi:hypothetical protein